MIQILVIWVLQFVFDVCHFWCFTAEQVVKITKQTAQFESSPLCQAIQVELLNSPLGFYSNF